MKKAFILFMGVAVITFTFFYSCTTDPNTDPENSTPTPGEIFTADALEATDFGVECTDLLWNPPAYEACLLSAGAAATFASIWDAFSWRSSSSAGNGLGKHNLSQVILPDQYKIASNPYECLGDFHNRAMFNILNNSAGRQTEMDRIMAGDDATLRNYVSMFAACTPMDAPTQDAAVDNLKQSLPAAQNTINQYKNITISQAIANSHVTSPVKTYIYTIHDNILSMMRDPNNTTAGVERFINTKITDIINAAPHGVLDSDSRSELAFLTVLKNSYYYWMN